MPILNKGIGGRKSPANDAELADDSIIGSLVDWEIRARSLRNAIFDSSIIDDSSWPLVQRLFDAHLKGIAMRTKELYVDTEIPQTTVLRYVDHLVKCEVVRRDDDPDDSRVTLVSLTGSAADWLREYYTQLIQAEPDRSGQGE